MNKNVKLYIPRLEDLWYRQKLMQDPATMSYNKGYDLSFDGYDKTTGCITFPQEKWKDWHEYFINHEPQRFYAYFVDESNGAFIGEVNVHRNEGAAWHEMGIVIEAEYRRQGYGKAGLQQLLDYAFETLNIDAIHNDFEKERDSALSMHLDAGFSIYKNNPETIEVLLDREEYLQRKASL